MPTSTQPIHPPSTAENVRAPLRLRLKPELGTGALDGSWWPQSRDLPLELADLVDHFPKELGVIDRVVFSRPDWDTAPHRIRVARGVLKVGSYPGDDTSQVWLFMSTRRLIRLSVTRPVAAATAETGSVAGNVPFTLGVHDGMGDDLVPNWDDDGDSWWDPHPVAPSHRT
jgi:hypothetical protein